MGDSTPFTVRRLNGALGAEVTSIDLTAALDNATFEPLRQAFLDNCVLVFPDQNLDAESLLHFGQRWGKPIFAHHYPTRLKDCLEVIKVINYGKRKTVTENWHSDWAFWPTPPSISIASAQSLPAFGGDTMFSNQYLAYDALSDGMKHLLGDLRLEHIGTLPKAGRTKEDLFTLHPVVKTHPETGRKALWIGVPPQSVTHFEDMTNVESRPLLDQLASHSTRPDRVYRHTWRPGDVVMWDNRCTLHYGVHDYGDKSDRLLYRVTIEGGPDGSPPP